MSCSPEDIEKKRLQAIERRNARQKEQQSLNPGQEDQNLKRTMPAKQLNVSSSSELSSPGPSTSSASPSSSLSPTSPRCSFFHEQYQVKGSISMISNTRFEVNINYHQGFIDFCHKFDTRYYDPLKKLWSFDVKEYDKFMQELRSVPRVLIIGLPRYVYRIFVAKSTDKSSENQEIDFSGIDPKLRRQLMPFQREGIYFAITRNGRCMIADDMGLGKTLQALAIANYYQADWPLLIVSPASLTHMWLDNITKFLPSVEAEDIYLFSGSKGYFEEEKIIIVSYDLLVKCKKVFVRKQFKTLILDESHFLKNYNSERIKAVEVVAKETRHIVLLSGTPALSRPYELYAQIRLIEPTFFKRHNYGLRYCAGKEKQVRRNVRVWNYSGVSNPVELQLLLSKVCVIRRMKDEVLDQLPSKIRQFVILDPNLVNTSSEALMTLRDRKQNANQLMQLFTDSGPQKLKAVCNYVSDLLEKKRKFIIFAHHKQILDGICEVIEKKGVQYVRIDGQTDKKQRQQRVDLFQESEDIMVAVLSIVSSNSGFSLTRASLCVFAELYWNPGSLVQAEDRVYRIGQRSPVVIQYLIANGTVDDHLLQLIESKNDFLVKAGFNQNFALSSAEILTQNDN
ncbi:GSCOCG00001355001-RA-CDS [Cotesia congregata]|uniref:Similar to smarcal1: SWI/SNF-related matrix-associated actin-dependent regulator of chromatin subfamily A-like protein 1 (Xenopus tropicalis) n=1 Tax=Cotesia congregata TaxID=51543 RepID=A0A8J2HH04_COTCN|nr:GSCOCG00001355001-RA-CDS [Cotesia congregata]CAG5097151.1 Similar to smarcal1: SWI/SNF-related matrix-associated actin-dependent regulator of chromatin subfamily A-like protein 1 (Xenopus tropicalis) [Cotesia congregata]